MKIIKKTKPEDRLNRIIFKISNIYNSKALKIQQLSREKNPILFVESLCNLKGPEKIIITHKSLKMAAKFSLPNRIFVDFDNQKDYILLCIAHEYAHILLRKNISVPYPLEQNLAILLQLAYEDFTGIRKFSRENARELMELMNVWPVGRTILEKWPSYLESKTGLNNKKYPDIIAWLKNILEF